MSFGFEEFNPSKLPARYKETPVARKEPDVSGITLDDPEKVLLDILWYIANQYRKTDWDYTSVYSSNVEPINLPLGTCRNDHLEEFFFPKRYLNREDVRLFNREYGSMIMQWFESKKSPEEKQREKEDIKRYQDAKRKGILKTLSYKDRVALGFLDATDEALGLLEGKSTS